MKQMKNGEGLGEEYCDKVGDFFKTSHILRLMRKYYRENNCDTLKAGQKLKIWDDDSKKEFSQDFLDFTLNIFRNEENFQDFFTFISKDVGDLGNSRLIQDYNKGEITTAILALNEVFVQLGYFNMSGLQVGVENIKSIFQIRIADILEKTFYAEQSEEHSLNMFASVEKIMDYGFIPINKIGQILTFLSETEYGILVVPLVGGEEELLPYSNLEHIDVSRLQVIHKIKMMKRILLFNDNEVTRLNPEENDLLQDILKIYSEQSDKLSLFEFINKLLVTLESQISRLPAQDNGVRQRMKSRGDLNDSGEANLRVIQGGNQKNPKRIFPLGLINSY